MSGEYRRLRLLVHSFLWCRSLCLLLPPSLSPWSERISTHISLLLPPTPTACTLNMRGFQLLVASSRFVEFALRLADFLFKGSLRGSVHILAEMEVLRNPIHLFRTDGVSLRQPSFLFTLLPRSPGITLLLNKSLAHRHLTLNHCPSTPPSPNIMLPYFYTDKHYLEFRTEDAHLPEYRLKAVFESKHRRLMRTTVARGILRQVMHTGQHLLPTYAQPNRDILCRCTPLAYLSSTKQLEREFCSGLAFTNSIRPNSTLFPSSECPYPWDNTKNYATVLVNTYLDDGKVGSLKRVLEVISEELERENSLFAYLVRTGGDTKEWKFRWKRTLEVKKWGRKHVDLVSTRLLCMTYTDLLSTYDQLPKLPSILTSVQQLLSNTKRT